MTNQITYGTLFRWIICMGILLAVLFWRAARPERVQQIQQAVFGTAPTEVVEVFGEAELY